MSGEQWAAELVERVAGEVRRLRIERKWSARQLADRTAELGHPISRAAITNLENGRKTGVDVAELLVLAEALGVPALQLVYPGADRELVERVPDVLTPTVDAAKRFAGWLPDGVRIRYEERGL